jgi:hypothetical protein
MKLNLKLIMIDSGAFSAWKKGEKISLGNYIAYLKRNAAFINTCVCLDTIPGFVLGEKGVCDRNPRTIEAAAKESYENQQKMKAEGLSPIPVFHMDEKFVWLDRYRDDNEGYIGLSPSTFAKTKEIMPWLDECFARLKAVDRPVKTHCYGNTTWEIASSYPWTSLDSTTWWRPPIDGKIIVPSMYVPGDYDVIPVTDGLTHEPNHLEKLPEAQQDFIWAYLKEKLGIEGYEVRYDPENIYRMKTGILYFQDMQARLPSVTFIYATNTSDIQRNLLNEFTVEHRLLSYYDLTEKNVSDDFLETYYTNSFRMSRQKEERIKLERVRHIYEREARYKAEYEAMTPEERKRQKEYDELWGGVPELRRDDIDD